MPDTSSGGRPAADFTEEDGYRALREHVLEKALLARQRYGPRIDAEAMTRVLADRDIVRFPTTMRFDARPLMAGEFACPVPLGDRPADGYDLVIHSHFAERPEALPLIAAYHVVAINYLDVATNVEAELFGAALLGMEVDEYYRRVCELADELGGAS